MKKYIASTGRKRKTKSFRKNLTFMNCHGRLPSVALSHSFALSRSLSHFSTNVLMHAYFISVCVSLVSSVFRARMSFRTAANNANNANNT